MRFFDPLSSITLPDSNPLVRYSFENTYPIWLHTIFVFPIMVSMFVCEWPYIHASMRLSAMKLPSSVANAPFKTEPMCRAAARRCGITLAGDQGGDVVWNVRKET